MARAWRLAIFCIARTLSTDRATDPGRHRAVRLYELPITWFVTWMTLRPHYSQRDSTQGNGRFTLDWRG